MKKAIIALCGVLFIIVIFIIVNISNTNIQNVSEPSEVIVSLPNSSDVTNVNGYKDVKEDTSSSASSYETSHNTSSVYYANTKTKKFHLPDCRYAQSINEERLYICESYDELINDGYSPCLVCNP